jgi:hypothetical protein
MNNPLLGGTTLPYTRRTARQKTDVHAQSFGSGNIGKLIDHSSTGQGRDRLAGDRSGGYSAYPPPPPITARARRGRSDIHQQKRSALAPTLPRPKDSAIYGSSTATFDLGSPRLAKITKQYEDQRRASPRNTSFNRYEQQRSVGQPMQPEIPNQGQVRTPKKAPVLPVQQQPNIMISNNQRNQRNPKHQSWDYQEKQFEKNAQNKISIFSGGVAPDNGKSISPRRRGAALQTPNGRYFRPQYLDSNDRSYPKDSPTYRRDGTVAGFNPAKTSVLDGYSCFIKEYHQRSLKPQRRALPRAQNYRDFEKSSRDEYRQNFIRREQEMQQLCAAPLPMPSAMMSKVQRLQPVAPMGIYQWPGARRWGCSSGGYAGTGV